MKKNDSTVPRLSKKYLEELAESKLDEWGLHYQFPTPIDDIVAFRLGLEIDFFELPNDILGLTAFKEKTIIIKSSLVDNMNLSGRYRFTLAHECGHYILHRDYYLQLNENQEKCSVIIDNEKTIVEDQNTNKKLFSKEDRLEWQANYFAACILMPEKIFQAKLLNLFKKYDLKGNYLFIDKQPCNIVTERNFFAELSNAFSVSRSASFCRMNELGYIKTPNDFSY